MVRRTSTLALYSIIFGTRGAVPGLRPSGHGGACPTKSYGKEILNIMQNMMTPQGGLHGGSGSIRTRRICRVPRKYVPEISYHLHPCRRLPVPVLIKFFTLQKRALIQAFTVRHSINHSAVKSREMVTTPCSSTLACVLN